MRAPRKPFAPSTSTAMELAFPPPSPRLVTGSERSKVLRALTQDVLLDLAGGGLRQVAEDHRLRNLEAGEMLAAPGDDVLRCDFHARLGHHEGARRLAPF